MSTVNKELAEEIMKLDGYYSDDPRVMQIVQYVNNWGGDAYAILYAEDVKLNRYEESEYVRNPQIIWSAK